MDRSREMTRVVRRAADQVSTALADAPASPMFFAEVTSTAPLEVAWRGQDLPATAVDPYVPVVADWVLCALVSNQVTVLGRTA